MRTKLLAALLGAAALPALAQQQPTVTPTEVPAGQAQAKAAIAECDRLVSLLNSGAPGAGLSEEQVRAWKQNSDAQACRVELDRIEAAQIRESAPAPAASVSAGSQPAPAPQAGPAPASDPATPRVVIQQAQPTVTVRQAQPEILVRLPPPVITVLQPQPEIIVRMPEPDVNVAVARPEVQVQAPAAEAQVQVERQQPNVRVERMGEPRIVYQPAEGQPQIRFEPSGPGRTSQAAPASVPTQSAQAQLNSSPAPVAASPSPQTTGALPPPTQALSVARLRDHELYNARDQKLGEVESVLAGPSGQTSLVVSYGGFLGLGERRVAVPLERVALRGDRLVADALSDEDLRALPSFDRDAGYREMDENQNADVRILR